MTVILLLLLCVLVNTLIAVAFKSFVQYEVDTYQAIVVNYLTCVVIGSLVAIELPFGTDALQSSWFWYAVLLGCLFITGFNVAAFTIRYFGMTVTTVVQKMSLICSVAFAILLYAESAGFIKLAGVVLAMAAVILINFKPAIYNTTRKNTAIYFLLPAATFLFSGVVEIILYYVKAEGLSNDDLSFTTHCFAVAFLIGMAVLAGMYATGNARFAWRNVWWGVFLGIPNFFSIYLILTLLKHGVPGSVLYPVLNISVLVVVSLTGILFYTEKLSKTNFIGLAIALLSILAISLAA